MLAAKAAERLPYLRSWLRTRNLPGFDAFDRVGAHPVIKSVIATGRVNLLLTAAPESRAVVLIRHPCGQIASVLRGLAKRKFESRKPHTEDFGVFDALAATPAEQRYGLSPAAFRAMPPVDRPAWEWVLMNQKAMDDIAGSGRGQVLRYEELCERPAETARALFAAVGLSWNDGTERFIAATIRPAGDPGYYGIFRDPLESAHKWKQELPAADAARILAGGADTPPGRLFA